jgi:hypothetical protein
LTNNKNNFFSPIISYSSCWGNLGPTDNEVNANECQRVSLAKAYDVLNIHGCETSMYVSIRVARRMSKGFWPKRMMCETSMGETSMYVSIRVARQELEILKNKTYQASIRQPYAQRASSHPIKPWEPCKLWKSAATYLHTVLV